MVYDTRRRQTVISTSDARGKNSPTLINAPCLSMQFKKKKKNLSLTCKTSKHDIDIFEEKRYPAFQYSDLKNSTYLPPAGYHETSGEGKFRNLTSSLCCKTPTFLPSLTFPPREFRMQTLFKISLKKRKKWTCLYMEHFQRKNKNEQDFNFRWNADPLAYI